MKLQIKSLEVKNCGPLRDVEIDFTTDGSHPRPVTVIGGPNGSGKTTILELVVTLTDLLRAVPLRSPDKILRILNRTEAARLNLLVDDEDFKISWGEAFSEKANWGLLVGDDSGLKLDSRGKLVNQIRDAIRGQKGKSLKTFLSDQPQARRYLPSILYFPAYRRLHAAQGQHLAREDVFYEWVYRYDVVSSFEGSLDSYLIWLDYAQADSFVEVREFLNETIMDGKAINGVNRSELATMVKTVDGQIHRLDELSSGEQNLLIIMLELRRRLLSGSIVLIDEIENSLHPALQHRFAEALLKLQEQIPFQLIVTTHAPSFVETFGPESTLLLTDF